MKKYLTQLSILSLSMLGGSLFAETPPEGQSWFRANNLKGVDDSGVSFSDLSTWNEYSVSDKGGDPWNAISMELLPWQLSWASDKQINLKMDNSIVNVDSAVGSADNFANINVDLLWYSNLNIRSDFYITGNLNQAGYSNLRVESGAKASVNTVGNFDSIVLDGDGTLLTSRTSSTFRDGFSSSNGASLSVLGNNYAYFEGSNSGSAFDSSTISGNIEVRNGGILHLKKSVFNAGSNNNPIQASGKASLTFDASELNTYYNGWDSSLDSASRWNGNIMFIGGGGGAQQTFTFKNGTVVNGGGAADGTSYWDMDESTRTLSDISAGGTLNLGWNSFSSEQDFIEVNLESGTQYAGSGISFGDNHGTMSAFGSITVNQSGTDMADGYTRVHLKGDVNIRASTYRQNAAAPVVNTYSSNYNMLGNTELLTGANLNIGHAAARGGSANFNIYGSNNTVEVSALFFNSGSDVVSDDAGNEYISDATVNLVFDKNSSNNTFRARGDVNSAFGALGTNNFVLDGTGNTFYANSLNLANSTLNAGQTGNFKMLGQGNVLNVTRFMSSDGGTQDSATGGSISALFKGSSAANKNKVYVRDAEMIIQGSSAAESSLSINYEFAGNTVLRGASDNSGVWFKLHEWDGKQYTSNSSFTISGSGNDLLFSGLEIGKANGGQGGGKAVFKVSGGGNRIVVSEENAAEHNGFKVESGGELLYEVQNSGTSSILDYTGKVTTFTGKLTVDLSAMTRATQDSSGLVGGWERFDLYATYGTGILVSISNWFTKDDQMTMDDPFGQGYTYLVLNEEYVSLIARDESDEYVFVIDEGFVDDVTGDSLTSLSLWYKSTVPEPATYAAILGALALALAAYKRRK